MRGVALKIWPYLKNINKRGKRGKARQESKISNKKKAHLPHNSFLKLNLHTSTDSKKTIFINIVTISQWLIEELMLDNGNCWL